LELDQATTTAFWHACVEEMLVNVYPNCGDGFCARPVRPSTDWKNENHLDEHSIGGTVTHRPVDRDRHGRLSQSIKDIPAGDAD